MTERRIREVELLQLVRISEENEQRGDLECTQRWWTFQYQESGNTKHRSLESLKSECQVVMNKYPAATSVVQQVYTVLSDIENHARCTPVKVGESSEWTSAVNSSEKNRANFAKL
jgi:hypothetical protein